MELETLFSMIARRKSLVRDHQANSMSTPLQPLQYICKDPAEHDVELTKLFYIYFTT